MQKKIIVSGSIAIDTLFHHNGVIQDAITDKETISAAFNVRSQQHFFGGCAGNIVFNAALHHRAKESNAHSLPFTLLGVVGNDFADYEKWLTQNAIETSHVVKVNEAQTAHAYVMSDTKNQQLIFFYEGPGLHPEIGEPAVRTNLEHTLTDAVLVHVAPNSRWFMTTCMEQAKAANVPYFFDPGQAINVFTKEELREAIVSAHALFLNEYEYARASEMLGVDVGTLLESNTELAFILTTKGEKGSTILVRNQEPIEIAASSTQVVDPTGCGDAYRGAFLSTLHEYLTTENIPLEKFLKTRELLEIAGQAGASLAGRCLAVQGTQHHTA